MPEVQLADGFLIRGGQEVAYHEYQRTLALGAEYLRGDGINRIILSCGRCGKDFAHDAAALFHPFGRG